MVIPLKLTWAISALRHQVDELFSSSDRVPREHRFEMALREIENVELWINYLQGAPMPFRSSSMMFKITFFDDSSLVIRGRKRLRSFLERDSRVGQIRSIMQSEYSWQHASIEEVREHAYELTNKKEGE